MSKTTPLPIRFPTAIWAKVDEDAKLLRRSKASIVVEIIENHYDNGKPTPPPLATKKKAGAR